MKISHKQTVLLLILSIISIFVFWYIQNVQSIKPFFASYDPYYHYAITTQYAQARFYDDTIQSSVMGSKIMYTTLLNHTALSFAVLTNSTIKDIFYYWWWILLLLSFLMAIVLWKNISWTYTIWVLTWCVRLVSYYVLLRHSMFLPENSALFLLLFFLLQLQKKQHWIALFVLLVYGYFHYRSRYIPLWCFFLFHVLDLIKTKNYKSFIIYCFLWVSIVFIAYPINGEFMASMQYIISWYLWLIPHWWAIAPNKELYVVPSLWTFIQQYGVVVWNLLLITLFVQWAQTVKQGKKNDVFEVMVVLLFTVLLVAYFSSFIAKSIPTYRFAPYILLFGMLSFALHLKTMKYSIATLLILWFSLFSGFSIFYSRYWRTWITKSDAAAIHFVQNELTGSIAISLWAPLYTMMSHAEWDPEFMSRVLYTETEEQLIWLLQSRYGKWKLVSIIASTNQVKARQKSPLPVYAILQKYLVMKDEAEYTQVYRIDLARFSQ